MLTLDMLQSLWPNCDAHYPGLAEAIATQAPDIFPKYGLNDDLTIAHAMAQFSVESNLGTQLEENLHYSAQGLLKNWPTHFDADTAVQSVGNPNMIANRAYGGRMGNAPLPSTDGFDFRGRGLCQITGRSNYTTLANTTGLDIVNNPGMLSDPNYALECGVGVFVQCGALPYAENDQVVDVTQRVNGGQNGIDQRTAWLAKWKAALGVPDPAISETVTADS